MSRWLWSSIISSNHPGTIEGDGAAILDGDSNRFILAIHCRGFFTSVYLVPDNVQILLAGKLLHFRSEAVKETTFVSTTLIKPKQPLCRKSYT
ncbi:hypothetical protein [Desulfosediminicola ganghwensis]|uniref:hypothetical protein n=1 Tax=Desulfosediminicola ganghwensis TaxID=2569540 RepID=UPI001594C4A6|nr:hypothetical protein [Desulfosediminicola ganghwensis]